MDAPGSGTGAVATPRRRCHPLLPFLAVVPLLTLPVHRASGADVLVADTYIETPALKRFARSFRTQLVLAICSDALVAQPPKSKTIGCERESCPPNGCAPDQCDSPNSGWRELAYYSDCGASAFLLAIDGVRAGPIQAATSDRERNRAVGHMEGEGYRFRFGEADYLVRTVMTNKGGPGSRARLEVLRNGKPYATLLETDAHDMEFAVTWMGDLNGDGAPDFVVAGSRNIYEKVNGLFLSRKGRPGSYSFVRQRETGGTL